MRPKDKPEITACFHFSKREWEVISITIKSTGVVQKNQLSSSLQMGDLISTTTIYKYKNTLREMKKSVFLRVLTIGVFLLFTFGFVGALDISSCGTLAQNTNYALTQDVNISSGSYCMLLNGINISLDCLGHKIKNNGTAIAGVDSWTTARGNFTIKNCIFENFTEAGFFRADNNVILDNVTIYGRGPGSYAVRPDASTIGLRIYNSKIYDVYQVFYTQGNGENYQTALINNTFYSITQLGGFPVLNKSYIIEGNRFYNSTTSLASPSFTFIVGSLVNSTFKNNIIEQFDLTSNFLKLTNASSFTFSNNTFGSFDSPIDFIESVLVIDGGENVIVSNNRLYVSDTGGINLYSSSSNLTNVSVSDNSVYMNGTENSYGLTLGSDSGGELYSVINSSAYNNYINSTMVSGGSHTFMVKNAYLAEIYNNTVIGGYYGFVFKNNRNTNFYNNRIMNSSNFVFHDKGSQNCLIYDNYFEGNSLTQRIVDVYSDVPTLSFGFNETYKNNLIIEGSGFSGRPVSLTSNVTEIRIINSTYSSETVTEFSNLSRYWYLNASSNIAGANITVSRSGAVVYSALSPGFEQQTLVSYVNEGGTKTNETYNISAAAAGYRTQSESFNMTNNTNIIFTMVDGSAPNIVLVYPSEGYSQTASSDAVSFQFNVSDDLSDIAYCSLFLNGVEYVNTSAISESDTNTIAISSIGAGSQSWYVYCNDTLGNGGNSSSRRFTINEVATEEEETSEGSGIPTYFPTETNLQLGYSRHLYTNWKINFKVSNKDYQLELNSFDFGNKTAKIIISPGSQTKTILVGEEWNVNLNDDSHYDLLVRLENITSIRAEVFIKAINESLPGESREASNPSGAPDDEYQNKPNEEIKDKDYRIYTIITLIAILAGILTLFVIKKKQRRL